MTKLTLPGLIDPHVHLRDPGQTEKEDFYTGTSAAVAGGFTTVLDMPNNVKPIHSPEALSEKMVIAQEKIVCDIGFYYGSIGNNLHTFNEASKKTFGLKIFLNQTTGGQILDPDKLEEIFKTWPQTSPILFHAENETFDLVLEVLNKHRRPVHLCHLSSRYELQKVIAAKEQGHPLTCGVTPHHLFLSDNDESNLKHFGMMKPPLQSRDDVDFLWKHLNVIDCIESDHAPHTKEEKESDNPPYGVPNLETTLPLLLNAAIQNRLSTEDIIRLCCNGPKNIFHIPTDETTTVEVDTNSEHEIKNENLFTKCQWTPYNGWKVKGRVTKVTIKGIEVFDGEKVTIQPGFGRVHKSN